MALVCDIKSDTPNEDLEDGEIEDDEEEPQAPPVPPPQPIVVPQAPPPSHVKFNVPPPPLPQQQPQQHDNIKYNRRKHEDKRKPHLTEAEKHVMQLHKLERLEREKREKYRREQGGDGLAVDDFASNIEKAIANVLKKERPGNNEEKDEEKRGRKRKKKDRRKNDKHRRTDSPKQNVTCEEGEPPPRSPEQSQSSHGEESVDSECSSDNSREKKHYQRGGKQNKRHERKYNRERSREQRVDTQLKDNPSVCLFYLQGKCNKGDDCPYSHEVMLPMKLELCKFYQMECCAKGDKCLYMHSEFPCKFYHTGLPCPSGNNCKFAHGKPLSDGLKQILFKHIETAPREILGGFPRLSREEVFAMINQTQKALEAQEKPAESEEKGKEKRSRPSRWQDADQDPAKETRPFQHGFSLRGFYTEQDRDLRAIDSNGDVDMRQLPQMMLSKSEEAEATIKQDVDIRNTNFLENFKQDVDSRVLACKDVDCRRLPGNFDESDDNLQIDERKEDENRGDIPSHLPKKQRELFMRIQSQQKDATLENQPNSPTTDDNNINWYSDSDDDDNRLTIKDDNEDVKDDENPAPAPIKPVEVIEKLGDLSKIDISDAVTKLLSSITQQSSSTSASSSTATVLRDPRQASTESQKPVINDPRRARASEQAESTTKPERLSIYEQGGLSVAEANKDVDLRMSDDLDLRGANFGDTDLRSAPGRPDIDLRQLTIPFKGIQNYTPASEIDASINSHPPIVWRVHVVDVPRPDYTGLKLNLHDAQTTGDPRLRKIFRLSVEEKDSPASPKESPKARVDPRRRKMEEMKSDPTSMSYTQQLSVLQNSAFYQSLTSNQKLLLNQELATRADQTGNNDAVLNGILTNLGLISNVPNSNIPANVSALSILASVNNLGNVLTQTGMLQPNPQMAPNQVNPNILAHNPNLMNQMAQGMVQPGLLGAAPGIPNLPPMNFDPRNGGLLGNGPGFGGPNYGFNEEFYDGGGGGNYRNDNRGYNRDGRGRRGGRNNFNRNNMRKFRNMNRNQRGHTPP